MKKLVCRGIRYSVALMCCCGSVWAEYKPGTHVSAFPKGEVQKGVAALKSLSGALRECLVAELMGLVFSPDATRSAYADALSSENQTEYYPIHPAARYIDRQGESRNWQETYAGVKGKNKAGKSYESIWTACKQAIATTSEEAILAEFSDDVTNLALQAAKYHLNKLPIEMRDAWFALYGDMLYMQDGSSAYTGSHSIKRHGVIHMKRQIVTRTYKRDALFIDSKGKEQRMDDVFRDMYKISDTLRHINWCASLVGVQDILSLYPQETNAMRIAGQAKKKLHQPDNEEAAQKPAGLANRGNVGYRPKVDTSKISEQNQKELEGVAAYLHTLPLPTLSLFIAERLGILYMPANGNHGYSAYGWYENGSRFIGIDGREYDSAVEIKKVDDKGERDAWNTNSQIVERLGREKAFALLPSETAEIVLQNAKYHLDIMAKEQPERRDMYLAYLAELCYLSDGKSPYGKKTERKDPRGKTFTLYDIGDTKCQFIDTKGTEYAYDEISRKYASQGGSRWAILNICAYHLGKEAILNLYPEEMNRLRSFYKERMQQLKKEAPPEEDADESLSEEGPTELAKALGATYPQSANATSPNKQAKDEIKNVEQFLHSVSIPARSLFIAERLAILFMPANGAPGHSAYGWYENGSHFIGMDGREYDSVEELNKIDNTGLRPLWNKCSDIVGRHGREQVFARISRETAEIVLQNAKYQLEQLGKELPEARDLFLAHIAQLEYLTGGKASYKQTTWKDPHGREVKEYIPNAARNEVLFTDSTGKEHNALSVQQKVSQGRWRILNICAYHLGANAILALRQNDVKKLRANYKKRLKELSTPPSPGT